MAFRGVCLAYLLSVLSTLPAAADSRSRMYAECGFLVVIAVEQVTARASQSDLYHDLRKDAVQFAELFVLSEGATPSAEDIHLALEDMAQVGRAVHARRVAGMSERGSLRMSNRILSDCRADLHLLRLKFEAELAAPKSQG